MANSPENMTISQAIKYAKRGSKIARKHWRGKWVEYSPLGGGMLLRFYADGESSAYEAISDDLLDNDWRLSD